MADELTNINGVEILRTGKWRGRDHGDAELDEMVENFEALSEGRDFPLYVVDHPTNPTALKAGIVSKLYRKGQKLLADVAAVPQQIATLWEQNKFRGVSSGIRYNYSGYEETKGPLSIALDHVAFLTRKPPAIPGLNLAERFAAEDTEEVVCYEADDYVAPAGDGAPDPSDGTDPTDPSDPTDQHGPDSPSASTNEDTDMPTVEQLQEDLAAKQGELEAAKGERAEEFSAVEGERDELKQQLEAAQQREAERIAADVKRDTEAQLEQWSADGKVLPAQKDALEYLLLHAPGNSVEEFAAEGGTKQTYAETLAAFVDGLPNVVEFSARTQKDGDTPTHGLTEIERDAADRLGVPHERFAQQKAQG